VMLGFGIGDAFGAGIEFKSKEWIIDNVAFDRYLNERVMKGDRIFKPGFYTDDTEMTIGMIKGLIAQGGELTEDDMIYFWFEEYKDGIKKIWKRKGRAWFDTKLL